MPITTYMSLHADAPAAVKFSNDCSLGQELDCNLLRVHELPPSSGALKFLIHRNGEIINICWFKLRFGVVCHIAIRN